MIKHVKNIKEEERYILKEGEEKFKDGVNNGFKLKLHQRLSEAGGIKGKAVVEVMLHLETPEAKQNLPYFEGYAFQKLHQHWIDQGDVVIAKI